MEGNVFVYVDDLTENKDNTSSNNEDDESLPKRQKILRLKSSFKDTAVNAKTIAKIWGYPYIVLAM